MEVDFVPYPEALELYNLGALFLNPGFPHLAIYRNGVLRFANQAAIEMFVEDFKEEVFTAPLYQQAFRWFRENHGLSFECRTPDGFDGRWFPGIHKIKGFGNYYDNDGFDTYKEAELACLRKLIEIVKSKQ